METTYKIAEVYPAFQGEVNIKGMGAPVIFLRLSGCHIRCYKKSLGTLCDTPAFLDGKKGTVMTLAETLDTVEVVRKATGISLVCLSGGDPLFHKNVGFLIQALLNSGYTVSVETSGIDYMNINLEGLVTPNSPNLSWVFDYKTKSAGIPKCSERNVLLKEEQLPKLTERDFIKFVIYDAEDFQEFLDIHTFLYYNSKAVIAVGVYWGGKFTLYDLFKALCESGSIGKVTLNAQLHKLAYAPNYGLNLDDKQL